MVFPAPRANFPTRSVKKNKRVFEIDFIRGFDIILVILCHFCWDLSAITLFFKAPASGEVGWVKALSKLGWDIFGTIDYGSLYSLEFFFAGLFMFICGISCSFSRSNIDRTLKLLIVGALMTVVLEIGDALVFGPTAPQSQAGIHIYLGIIQSLGIAMFFYTLVDSFFPSYWVDYALGILFSVLLGLSLYHWGDGPANWDTVSNVYKEGWRLFVGLGRAGDDYFPPSMTTALVFLGAVVGKTAYKEKKSLMRGDFPTSWAKPILWMGRHSLEIYLVHQPLVILILWGVVSCAGYTLAF